MWKLIPILVLVTLSQSRNINRFENGGKVPPNKFERIQNECAHQINLFHNSDVSDLRRAIISADVENTNQLGEERVSEQEQIEVKKVKQFFLCIYKKYGFITDSGNFRLDVMTNELEDHHVPEELIDNILRKCTEKKGTPEDTAFASAQCFIKDFVERIIKALFKGMAQKINLEAGVNNSLAVTE